MPGANRTPTPEALKDLKRLAQDHGINAEMIQSLKTCPEESRAHIRFFKRMMFVSNGALMVIGATLCVFGGMGLLEGFSVFRSACIMIGLLLFAKFLTVFLSMSEAIRETEYVAQKHNLI